MPNWRAGWYGCGKRVLDIYHTRLRLGCSGLKAHLHFNLHVEDDPYCRCRRVIEDPAHYLLHCPLFQEQRTLLLHAITQIVTPSLDIILYGDETLSINDNQYSHFPIGSNIYRNNKTVQIKSLVCTDHIKALMTIVTHSFTHLNVHVCVRGITLAGREFRKIGHLMTSFCNFAWCYIWVYCFQKTPQTKWGSPLAACMHTIQNGHHP